MSAPRRAAARTALICAVVAAGMTGAAFAAVPLYRAFCQITGFGGTPGRADTGAARVLDRTVVVRFDGNVRGLAWDFAPEQVTQTVKIGATTMALFKATNTGDRPLTGTSTFNVTPAEAGAHFRKIECFCFQEQTIAPGETVQFPVVYFVDPELASDPDARRVDEITLSYTFFPAEPKRAEARSGAGAPDGAAL